MGDTYNGTISEELVYCFSKLFSIIIIKGGMSRSINLNLIALDI